MRNELFLIGEAPTLIRNWPFLIRGSQSLSRNGMIMWLPRQGSSPFALRAIAVYGIGVGGCGLQVLRRRFRRTADEWSPGERKYERVCEPCFWLPWAHHAERVESGNSDPGRIGCCEATERPCEKPE